MSESVHPVNGYVIARRVTDDAPPQDGWLLAASVKNAVMLSHCWRDENGTLQHKSALQLSIEGAFALIEALQDAIKESLNA